MLSAPLRIPIEGNEMTTGRTPAESEVTLGQLMLPDDANPSGDVHGGVVMKLVDTAAGIAAMRHARSRCVTIEMDSMTFEAPVHVGDLLHLYARLNWTGRTSIEIEVTVEAENVSRRHSRSNLDRISRVRRARRRGQAASGAAADR